MHNLPITHLGHVASLDIRERVEGALESVRHCATHLMKEHPDAIARAVFEAAKDYGIRGIDALHGIPEPDEFDGLAMGTGNGTPVVGE